MMSKGKAKSSDVPRWRGGENLTVVIHYNTNKDPDVLVGMDEKTERSIVTSLKRDWNIKRASPKEWYGQDNPNYGVHHWNAEKKTK